MIHRTTLAAVPVIGLVVLSAGLGWWGASEHHQNQAAVQLSSNQTAQTYHAFASDMEALRQHADEALVSTNAADFSGHALQVLQWSDRAETQLSRLPAGHVQHLQRFLARTQQTALRWVQTRPNPQNPVTHQQLVAIDHESAAIADACSNPSPSALAVHASAMASMTQRTKTWSIDNALLRVDAAAQDSRPESTTMTQSNPLLNEPSISVQTARTRMAQFANVPKNVSWSERLGKNTTFGPAYVFESNDANHSQFVEVTQHGGHVVLFHIARHTTSSKLQDLSLTEHAATMWLQRRGYANLTTLDSHEIDGLGFFTFAATMAGDPVLNRTINLTMTMDTKQVESFHAAHYYANVPRGAVLSRNISAATMRANLSKVMHIEESRRGIVLDGNGRPIPVVTFYGQTDGKSYRVTMNANNGAQMNTERLS